MLVKEIFLSIQGEGAYTGYPTLFVRFQGCNLRCKYCDTKDSIPPSGGRNLTTGQIITELKALTKGYLTNYHVCLTGGEPMLQLGIVDLANTLVKLYSCKVNIETNGTIERPKELSPCVLYTMDIKCPSSGADEITRKKMIQNAFRACLRNIEIKCVVGTLEDLKFVEDEVLNLLGETLPVILSPMNGEGANPDIVGHIVKRMSEVPEVYKGAKIGIQLHKYLEVQ